MIADSGVRSKQRGPSRFPPSRLPTGIMKGPKVGLAVLPRRPQPAMLPKYGAVWRKKGAYWESPKISTSDWQPSNNYLRMHTLAGFVVGVFTAMALVLCASWFIRGIKRFKTMAVFFSGFVLGMLAMFIATHFYTP